MSQVSIWVTLFALFFSTLCCAEDNTTSTAGYVNDSYSLNSNDLSFLNSSILKRLEDALNLDFFNMSNDGLLNWVNNMEELADSLVKNANTKQLAVQVSKIIRPIQMIVGSCGNILIVIILFERDLSTHSLMLISLAGKVIYYVVFFV